MTLPSRPFGRTGLSVSALGLGAGRIGDASLSDEMAQSFLNGALDLGITFIDTARGYGASEERIGKFLSSRRSEFRISTKVGYGLDGHEDWTSECVTAGVEEALRRLRTDIIDVVHLHSCPVEVLQRGDVIIALEDAKKAGKIRVAAYAGEGDALRFAAHSGRFASLQTSINVCDQRVLSEVVDTPEGKNLGIVSKRPMANAPWRFPKRPTGDYSEQYWVRWKAMDIERKQVGMSWDELALRFAAFLPGVHSCVVGTTNLEHLRRNVASVQKGALDGRLVKELREAFRARDMHWTGQI
jgi:aryl-alcohol dehydrogenase-like predicted oxidoreductase